MTRSQLFRSPWWVVFGSTIGLMFASGPVLQFTFGVFLKPISKDFGWNRGTVAAALLVSHVLGAMGTAFVGKLVDRWGIRRVTLSFITVFACTVALLSRTPAYPLIFILLYGACGLAGSGQGPLPYAKAISAWFEERRGLALGIAMSGVGIGAALVPQIALTLIHIFGWRYAYVGLGILAFAFAFPSVALFVRDPTKPMLPNDVCALAEDNIGERNSHTNNIGDSGNIFVSARFWLIACAVCLVALSVNGTIAHLVPLLTDRGISTQTATSILSASGFAMIGGRILSGYLLDRFFAPRVAAFFFLVPLWGTLILTTGSSRLVLLIGVVCLGSSIGAEIDITAFLVGRYFDFSKFGEIYGYLFALFLLGTGLGPWLMGMCFDKRHSYNFALYGFSAALVVSSLLISKLGPYVYPHRVVVKEAQILSLAPHSN